MLHSGTEIAHHCGEIFVSPKEDDEFLARFLCESDAIEGIVDDPALVGRQIRRCNVRGHVGALLLLRTHALQKTPLTQWLIKQTQSLIVSEQHRKGDREIAKKYRGNWRDCDVWIADRKGSPPTLVPSQMLILAEHIVQWQATCAGLSAVENVTAIARFHYEYERIHPFIDGNGRSGRALVYYLYRFAGLTPFVFTAEDRHRTYYRCFSNPAVMREYFLERTALSA